MDQIGMSRIFFFSYARGDGGDHDSYLEEFYKDLCTEVAGPTPFKALSPEVSFRDTKDIPLMENWRTHIRDALQTSAVMTCVTSAKYFNSRFCGKEHYVFDQRRRQGLAVDAQPPANILSIVWYPVGGGLPPFMQATQLLPDGVPEVYLREGLRHLMRFPGQYREMYNLCVTGFAKAIRDAWKKNEKLKPLPAIAEFEDVPNQFAGGDWRDAADPAGWRRGPEVANFVFVAESGDDAPEPKGRYGESPAHWRPYLPPELTTIAEYAKKAQRKQFVFREILAGNDLPRELQQAKDRLNLSVVVGSPRALIHDRFTEVRTIEGMWWEGTALLVLCDDPAMDEQALRALLQPKYPILYSLPPEKNVILPIRNGPELAMKLATTLGAMRDAVKSPEIESKETTGAPPTTVTNAPGTGA